MQQRWKIILFSLASVVLAVFLLRNYFLEYAVKKICSRFGKRFNSELIISKSFFENFNDIQLSGIYVVPHQKDTFLTVQNVSVNVKWFALLSGKISFDRLLVDSVTVTFIEDSSGSNFSFIGERKIASVDTAAKTTGETNFARQFSSLFSKATDLVENNITINQTVTHYYADGYYRKFYIPVFSSNSEKFYCRFIDSTNYSPGYWELKGNFNLDENLFSFLCYHENPAQKVIPVSFKTGELKCLFDSAYVEARVIADEKNLFETEIHCSASQFRINHWRIAPEDVYIRNLSADILLRASASKAEIDSSSTVTINEMPIQVKTSFEKSDARWFEIGAAIPKISSQKFFSSLPEGMFHTLDGIKTKGDLKYTLHFLVNLDEPDSIEFDSQLEKFNFRIERYGNENFSKINSDFIHTVYENDYPVETFMVGSAHPWFTPLSQIPDHLKYSVLTAEDGTFLWHRGFNEEAFAQSISTNIKEKRFARGGSTITMQLVKNIFLGRNKTVARKLEEALIVWMIENTGIVSKDRILEVYLNIIEWGPGVYGIGEASQFYFSKKPMELSLNESIFLASIIPHPKYFKYSFDKEGNLKKYLSGFYNIVSDRMVRKEWIAPADTIGLISNVALKGEALGFVLPDTLRTDSIPVIDQEDFLN